MVLRCLTPEDDAVEEERLPLGTETWRVSLAWLDMTTYGPCSSERQE